MRSVSESATEQRHASGVIAKGGPHILLAEDDPDMRKLVGTALRDDGYSVVDASDGGEAMIKLASGFLSGKRHGGYSLLLCDVRMPIRSGTEVLDGIRRARWGMPMILMTAFGDPAVRKHVEEAGAELLDKPFELDDLRAAVARTLHEAPEREEEDREEPVLERVASRENGFDAWAIKWVLQANGIQAFLAGHATSTSAAQSEVYVLPGDAERARQVIMAEEQPAKIA